MNSSRIVVLAIVIIVMLIGAVFLGEAVALENYTTVGIFFSVVVAITVIKLLGSSIWVIIPILITFGGSSRMLPIPLSVANIATVFGMGIMFIQYAIGMTRFRWRLDAMEFFLGLCLASMAITYLLNPVGLSVLGSSTVGSRPYLEVLLAVMAYAMLSGLVVKPKAVQSLAVMTLGVNAVSSVLAGLSYHIVAVGERLNILYTGYQPNYKSVSAYGFQMAERFLYLGNISSVVQRYILLRESAWVPRITKLGVTVVLLLLALGAGMLTGHRIALITWVGFMGIYALLTRKIRLLVLMSVLGVFGIIGVYGFHHVVKPLPLSIQRTMSLFPGDWNADVMHDAEGSIEWRLEMWDAVLFEEGRVRNKIMGDGFGFSARELALAQSMSTEAGKVVLSPEEMQEYFLVSGDIHSGPLTAVRFVGFVGLFFFTILSIYVARCYWVLCRRTMGTPYWLSVAFVGIPWIWFPFKYIVLYGDYAHNIASFIVGAGLCKLIMKHIDEVQLIEEPGG